MWKEIKEYTEIGMLGHCSKVSTKFGQTFSHSKFDESTLDSMFVK
jgi:hypothetical protein